MLKALALVMVVGCSAPADCSEVAAEWFENLELDGRLGCSFDADCVIVAAGVACESGITIQTCGTAVAIDHRAAFEASLADARAELCASPTPSCVSSSLCPSDMRVICSAGVCRAR